MGFGETGNFYYINADNENSIYQTFNDVPAGKRVSFTGMAMTYNEDRIRGGNKEFLIIKTFDASWNALPASNDLINKNALFPPLILS